MERPPLATVIFNEIPSDWIAGIDLQFFNTNSVLKGIKLIPEGIHVLHFAQNQASIRSGFYINVKEGDVIIVSWDEETEKLLIGDEIGELNVSKELGKLSEYYAYMIKYPSDEHWNDLMRYIDWNQVQFILQKRFYIDSVMTSAEENNVLLEALMKTSKQRNIVNDPIVNSIIDQSSEEIKYSLIDLNNTIRPNSTSSEKTMDSLDKSWFLNHLLITYYSSSNELLLSEFQQAFLNMIIFANYSSSVQWLKVIRVLLNCKNIVTEKEALFSKFLDLLHIQFLKFPDEYVDQFIDEDFFKITIAEFDYNLKELNLHSLVRKSISLKLLLNQKFGIIMQGLIEDDDDLPVIVDI